MDEEDVARGPTGESARSERTLFGEDEPVMLAPIPRAEPADYHRNISGGWWALALVAGALAWVALLA